MKDAFICDAIRTPIGRYGGALSSIRPDDLGAIPLRALMERNPNVDWSKVDDLFYGCANQAGEDNRNVGRMSLLLAGMPIDIPATTLNRLCGSGMDAIGNAARAIKANDGDLSSPVASNPCHVHRLLCQKQLQLLRGIMRSTTQPLAGALLTNY